MNDIYRKRIEWIVKIMISLHQSIVNEELDLKRFVCCTLKKFIFLLNYVLTQLVLMSMIIYNLYNKQ